MEGDNLLKLIIERGPREGETLEFQPGKEVKVGRVVRGNTLAIKDAGISSQHLSIAFISGEWSLSDLDSSNGTIVNGNAIGAHKPVKLGDGDTIKIGELSSIKVSIGVRNSCPGPRRNPSRRTVKNVEQSSVGIAEKKAQRGRPRKKIPEESPALIYKSELKDSDPRKEDAPSALEEEASAQIAEKKVQRGRPRKKKLEESPALIYKSEAFAGNNSLKDSDPRKEDDDEINANEPKLQEVAVSFEKEEAPAHIVEKKKAQRGRTRKKKLEESPKKNRVGNNAFDGNSSLNDSHFEEENNKIQSKNNNVDPRIEDDETHGNEPMLQENADGFEKDVGKEEEEPDLEKMTLGEWFDYLQVSLTKEINDAAEELISDMRAKARMSKELMVQKRNEKNA